jgi:predicted restriction endonuclease
MAFASINGSLTMKPETLRKYIGIFRDLHRNQNPKWGMAPHKPVLLLAVIDEIERGDIRDNFIELTPELVAAFRAYWRVLVPPDTWLEKIVNPFRFMVQDGFWELVKNGVPVSTQSLGYNPTIRQLTTEVDGAQLSDDRKQPMTDNDSKKGFVFSSPTANVRAYQAKLLEMAQANMQLAFEFAQRLATIRSPVELLSVIAEFTSSRIAMFGKYTEEMAELTCKRQA